MYSICINPIDLFASSRLTYRVFTWYTTVKQADVGVALLSGFGDVNVDKGEDSNKKKEPDSGDIATSPNITVISPQELQAVRTGPVWKLKAKLVALGVDLKRYPELTEKEDLITLFEIKGREKARQNRARQLAKTKQMDSKETQREIMLEKQRKMQLRVEELQAQVREGPRCGVCSLHTIVITNRNDITVLYRVYNGHSLRPSKNSWPPRRPKAERRELN